MQAEKFDLALFQFDYDLSFAVFLMNADQTIYGRYGTRSDFVDAEREISLRGLSLALQTALSWHRQFASMRKQLETKRGPMPKYRRFGQFPSGKSSRYSRGFGDFAGRCTHCHDLRTAEQMAYRVLKQPVPDRVLYAWPMPDVVGLQFDPEQMATVSAVTDSSAAETAGFRVGDQLIRFADQPILSIADVQWVLQQASDDQVLAVEVRRASEASDTESVVQLQLRLPPGWRRQANIQWRSTTRVLRQRLLNGVEYRELFAKDRVRLGLEPSGTALRAARGVSYKSFGPIQRGDIILTVDGQSTIRTEVDLIAYIAQQKQAGEKLELTILRDGQQQAVSFPLD